MVIFIAGTHRLILPSPRLNDTESLVIPTVQHHAKSGVIYAFKKQSLPQRQLSLYFQHVNRPKIIETISFLRLAMGRLIQYKDYENVVWNGKIINQPFDFTHAGLRNNEFTIEFEGKRA